MSPRANPVGVASQIPDPFGTGADRVQNIPGYRIFLGAYRGPAGKTGLWGTD